VHILSGRITDSAKGKLKTALRNIVREFKPLVQFTADQDLILLGVKTENKSAVEHLLNESGFTWKSESKLFDRALACVSLPTCPLALAEAERALPNLLQEISAKLERHGLINRAPVIRVTGCPNGCARPYSAEIGIAGQLPGKYAIFLGGSPNGDRIARLWTQKVPTEKIAETLEPLFALWKNEGTIAESFGDYIQRIGMERIKTSMESHR